MTTLATLNNTTDLSALFGAGDAMAALAGSGEVSRRISIASGCFTTYAGKQVVKVYEERNIKVVIMSAAPLHRKLYLGKYSPDNPEASKLACWSANTVSPHTDVQDKPSKSCATCKYNIEGSGQNGTGKACRFAQTLAVVLLNEDGSIGDEVHTISAPATAIFGKSVPDKGHPLGAYARYLQGNGTHISSIVTEIKFEAGKTGKLLFKPIRNLTTEELNQVVRIHKATDLVKLVALNVKVKADVPKQEVLDIPDVTELTSLPVVEEVAEEFETMEAKTPAPTKIPAKAKPTLPTAATPSLVEALDAFDD